MEHFNLESASSLSMPLDPSLLLSDNNSPKTPEEIVCMACVPYQEAIGSLMYLAIATRPDISYMCSLVSQFLDQPGSKH